MARDPINVGSTANDGTGDTWRDAFVKVNANELELFTSVAANTSGVAANSSTAAANASAIATNTSAIATNASGVATNAQGIIDTTALITGFTKTYWFDANDAATSSSPISHSAAATDTYLTNDAAGSSTTSYNPDSKDALWNTSTNKFDFTSLKIGDTIEFRIDLDLSNAAAQEVDILMSLAEGTASAHELNINHTYYKTASTSANNTNIFRVYIGDENTRTGGARFRFASLDAATIVVNGWFYQITEV